MSATRRFIIDVFDHVPPTRGTVLLSTRVGYRVLDARPVESQRWHDRWAVQVRRLRHDEPITDEFPVMLSTPYAKGETPMELARRIGYRFDAGQVPPDLERPALPSRP